MYAKILVIVWGGGRVVCSRQKVSMQISVVWFLGATCTQPEQESICHSYGCLENKYSFRSAASASWHLLSLDCLFFFFVLKFTFEM